ncbi:MAG TPA: TldD/PmbA family protein, partial [Kosmotoga arenicorallina]|nr:TldD/PmbA family protein [Kosmotoga arenicorallina]
MRVEEFKKKVFESAIKKGLNDFELYLKIQHEFNVSAQKGALENYKDATLIGASFKVIENGKVGSSFTEAFSDESAQQLVKEAVENLKIIESEYEDLLYNGTGSYNRKDFYRGEFDKLPKSEAVKKIIELEEGLKKHNEHITMVPYNSFGFLVEEIYIANSKGLDLYSKNDGGHVFAMGLASGGETPKSSFNALVGKGIKDLDIEILSDRIVSDLKLLLNSSPIKSGKYNVIFRNSEFASFLSVFSEMFSAENVQKGLSLLKGRIEDKIASDCFTLIDDPFYEGSPINRYFDDQGVPTKKKHLVENGVLKTYLYDLKTAKKDNVESTGNAVKIWGYKAPTDISFINLIVKPGEESFEELLAKLGEGLVITGLDG